jgi:aminoglycoside 6'-N-acetyltransferase I
MIRKLKQADIGSLKDLLSKITVFSEKEVTVALELINSAVTNTDENSYNVFVFEENGKIIGYHCTGRRPLTDGVYDLYWIAADPESEFKGIGSSLLKHAEDFVKENNGRWLLAETSSRESYTGTRNFYLRKHYSIVAQINDFYSLGDNLIVFGKYFSK